MAKVSLRLYNREIEKLVDGSQIEEAIAHCKYILQSFPKHVETYRLLGKAYLENQRYGEATDIFQRVLSSTPDDFVSHIGLSIIREDEGNLDAAIWHMERAYEVQPSNGAIQDELRRLHGRRDGIEPPRIRLTRGALVRMYARGDLYQQAIAEVRALLAEDPQRPDMQALLAKMCYLSGKRVEATEVCGDLLNKYPYCFEANRILAEILPGTTRAEDAKVYRQRVNALDPYYAFTTAEKPLSADIPDNAVIIERLDWQAYEEGGQNQPKWAESLGINLDETGVKPQPMPEWMANPEQAQSQVDTTTAKTPKTNAPAEPAAASTQASQEAAQPTPENLIPEWMRDSGWKAATGAAVEEESTLSGAAGAEEEVEGVVKPGAIPDWLQALAPDVPLDEQNAPVDKDFESLFASAPVAPVKPEGPVEQVSAQEEPGPTWQVQDAAALEMPAVPSVEKTEDASAMPDWLKDLKTEAAPQAEEELPAWLKDIQPTAGEAASPQAAKAGESPDWLHEIDQVPTENPPAGLSAVETPAEPVVEEPSLAQTTALPAAEAESPDWLKDLSMPQEGEEKALSVQPEDRIASISNWVQEAQENPPAAQPLVEPEAEPVAEAVARPADELPEWLTSLTPEPPQEATATPAASEALAEPAVQAEAQPADVLPDWLTSLAPEPPQEAATTPAASETLAEPPVQAEAQPADELPEWLKSLTPEQPLEAAAAPLASETPVVPEPQAEALPQEELPEWLTSLAPGIPAETPAAPQASEQPPTESLSDWLKSLKPVDQMEPGAPMEAAQPLVQPQPVPSQEAAPASSLPDWLTEEEPVIPQEIVVDNQPSVETAAPVKQTGSLDSWLNKFEAEPTADSPTQPVQVKAAAEPAIKSETAPAPGGVEPAAPTDQAPVEAASVAPALPAEDNLPEWLKGLGAPQAEELAAPAKAEEPLPDWLTKLETGQPPKPPAEIQPTTDQDAALAWLESLAAKQGADEETLFVKPEARLEQPPAWVQEATTQAAETTTSAVSPEVAQEPTVPQPAIDQTGQIPPFEEAPPPVEAAAPSLPDWLKEFTPAEEVEPEAPAVSREEIPPAAEAQAEIIPETTPAAETLPDWLQDLKETPAPEAPPAMEKAPSSLTGLSMGDEDAALAWLESLAAKHGADEETLFVKPEERLEAPPAWVQEAATQSPAAVQGEAAAQAPVEEPAAELEPTVQEDAAPESPVSVVVPVAAVEATPTPPETVETLSIPSVAVPAEPQPQAEAAAVPSDQDAALAWLESLAAKHGADEETLFVRPEDRQEKPPAWVQAVTPKAGEGPAVEAPPPALESVMMSESDVDALSGAVSEAKTEAPAEVQAEPALETPAETGTAPAEEELSTVSAEAAVPTEPAIMVEPAAEMKAVETAPVEAAPVEAAPAETADTSLPDWLKGFETEETEAPTQPVQIGLQKAQAETGETAAPSIEAQPPVEEKPTWLAEFERSEGQGSGLVQPKEEPASQPAPSQVHPTDETLVMRPPVTIPQAVVSPPETAFPPIVKLAAGAENWQEVLTQAQSALEEGQIIAALQNYTHLIDSGQLIEEAIHDLRDALYHYPVEVPIWQALGDAYVRTNRLQDALDAYTKAEELLR